MGVGPGERVRRYAVAKLEEIDEISDGRSPSRPIRFHFGITSFGINSFTGKEAGERIINEHDEAEPADGQEELYFVHRGRARFELDGETVEADAGTFVFVPRGVTRTAFGEEPGTTILVLGGSPGEAYVPSGYELWAPLQTLYEAGKYEEAADRGSEILAAHPEYPTPFYNVACCESLVGRKAEAIEHLGRAIGLLPALGSLAAEDTDFDPIRDDPQFQELLGSARS